MTDKRLKQSERPTLLETVALVMAIAVVGRSLLDHGLTTNEAGLVLGLLGLIPVNRLDRRKNRE